MQEPNTPSDHLFDPMVSDHQSTRSIQVLTGGVVAALVGISIWYFGWFSPGPGEPVDTDYPDGTFLASAASVPVAPEITPEQREAARQAYAKNLDQLLRIHDLELKEARSTLTTSVSKFFEVHKKGVPSFADEALTVSNRWTAFWDSEEYEDLLKDLFAQHVVSAPTVTDEMGKCAQEYLLAINKSEQDLLNEVRSLIGTLPELQTDAVTLDEEAFRSLIETHIADLSSKVTTSTRMTTLFNVLTFTTNVASRTSPPSASILALALKSYFERAIAQFSISQDQVQSDALRLVDQLKVVLMDGSEAVWADYRKYENISKTDPEESTRQGALEVMGLMRNNGYLGLNAILELIEQRNHKIKSKAFQSIGGLQ